MPASSMCDGVEDCPFSPYYWYDKKGGEDEKGCTECKNGAVVSIRGVRVKNRSYSALSRHSER